MWDDPMSSGNESKSYQAIIWVQNSDLPGKRVSVTAENLREAKEKLESEYGKGNVFNLHNEEDASRPRK
jgi:hypothetical protein